MADFIYFNITIANTSTTASMLAQTTVNRTSNILDNPSQYYLSVIRYKIPANDTPIFIWPHSGGVETPRYYVTISYGGNDYTQLVTWVPTLQNVAATYDAYWYVTSYQHVIDLINTALNLAFQAAKTANPGMPPINSPFLTYDSTNYLFTMNAAEAYNNAAGAVATAEIYFNSLLWQFFESSQLKTYTPGHATVKNAYFSIKNNGNNQRTVDHPVTGVSTDIYEMTQEANTLYMWNDIRGLAITSSSIPVTLEQNSNTSAETDGLNYNIISDFDINTERGPDARTDIYYVPQAQWRFADMISTSPLRSIDVKIFWVDRLGRLYDLYLQPLRGADIKIMFRKKNISA